MNRSSTDSDTDTASDVDTDTETETELRTEDPAAAGSEQAATEATGEGAAARRLLVGAARAVNALERRWKAAIVVVLALAVAGGTWWVLCGDDLPEGAAFRLGETEVSADAVDRRVEALQALYGVEVPADAGKRGDFRRDAAKSMAVQLMLTEEAAERDIVIADKEVSDTLRTLVEQRYPDGGREAFVAALGELGATENQVEDEIRDQLLVSRLFDEVVGEVTVDDAELRAEFEERRDELATPLRRSLRNVVVADRAAARRVLQLLRSGEPFPSVARQYSLDASTRDAGGDLGPVARADLEGGYAKEAFRAPVGQVFGPVKTQYGWNVGKVERELPAEPASFARLREPLRQTVLAERSLEVWRDWLAEVISRSEVVYADAFRPDDPDAVPAIDQPELADPEPAPAR
jgi:peptidyl-prolyl cis-trans isomerase C